MVRGIYQTSDAGERPVWVSFGMSIAFVLVLIGGVCWAIQAGGDRICSMPGYWNYDSETYSTHATRALNDAGFSFESLSDKGDFPDKSEYCDLSSIKVRRFVVTDLRAPDDSRIAKAQVLIKFDGSSRYKPTTSVASYKPL